MSKIPYNHIESYVGTYVMSEDFAFQEQMRRADVALKIMVKDLVGPTKAEQFFTKGWGQVVSAGYLLYKQKSQGECVLSATYKKMVQTKIAEAIAQGQLSEHPWIEVNVRGATKPLMLHPTHPTSPGKYLDWQTVNIDQPIAYLNNYIKEAEVRFAIYEGKLYLKIEPEDERNIFQRLWKTDFANLLEKNGFVGLEKNRECPHITLLNSDVVAKIGREYAEKFGQMEGSKKCQQLFDRLLEAFNNEIKGREPIHFTSLAATYSEDYSPFEEVVVAKLEAPYAAEALQRLATEVKNELSLTLTTISTTSFHLTVATKYREPLGSLPHSLHEVIDKTGDYSTALRLFFEKFLENKQH